MLGTMNSSARERINLTGRPDFFARATACASMLNSHFPPNPPPSAGTITLTLLIGSCRVSAIPDLAKDGTWVEDQTVTRPSVSTVARTPCGSIAAGCE